MLNIFDVTNLSFLPIAATVCQQLSQLAAFVRRQSITKRTGKQFEHVRETRFQFSDACIGACFRKDSVRLLVQVPTICLISQAR